MTYVDALGANIRNSCPITYTLVNDPATPNHFAYSLTSAPEDEGYKGVYRITFDINTLTTGYEVPDTYTF
jgi:hypothetical protein